MYYPPIFAPINNLPLITMGWNHLCIDEVLITILGLGDHYRSGSEEVLDHLVNRGEIWEKS